ncbi:MAG: SusC/RagA family TonB-linked outer membrane protein [Prolixibacteraceae bacterium]|nr:SusC/RagA family TonB-linked outer membrane protein [Prolixibacteraceae bacterium]MBT6763642.1 SusC/RagA family TonB-linked outer membrane protein [Prolixibacteraceae bacterium]MBT6997262.1 SusC/RagA family TonB-linked outer membrane protein [Prolixibacteraceae bacterium]
MQTSVIMNYRFFLTDFRKLAVLTAFLIIGISTAFAQDTLLIKGTIVNGANQPVANVSVGIEGAFELPAVTNQEGEFTLKALTGSEWLNISPSSDYKNKRVFLNNREVLTIYLTNKEIESGDDVISILSQDILKRDMVSAFSTLNSDNIKKTTALSVDQYMQGRVPGMHVINRSGDPGSGAVTMIRGINSLNASNRPLYVVDGIPINSMGVFGSNLEGFEYNPLLGINTLDISQITIIKDPSVTAAYGSKASNGVVFIETLDPSATQTVIELDLRTGYSLAPSNQIPQMSASQHKTLVSELLFSSGLQEELIIEEFPNLYLTPEDERYIDYQHATNWQDMIFSDAAFTNLNINVKGGDEIARYGLSFGYINGDGIIKTTGYDGYNLRFVSLLNIFTWLKMDAGVSVSYNNSQLKESGKIAETSPILTSLAKSPMLNPYQYDEDGLQLTTLAQVDELGVSNPQAVIDNYEAKNNNFNFTSALGFEATLKKDLILYSNFGLNYNVLKEQLFMPNRGMERYYNDEAINVSKASNNNLTSFYSNTYLKFNKKLGRDHVFSTITGLNILSNKFEYDWGLTKNAHQNDEYRMLQDGTNNLREIGGANRTWNWLSIYENLTYSYKDKYIAMASFSLDGSSRVGDNAANTMKLSGVPFGLFYSAGAAWRISNESFLKDKSTLEELKLRLTFGRSGNDDIGESNATNYYNAIKFRETSGLYPALLPNDELTYEMVSQINAGIDLSLWGNRLSTTFDIYKSQTDNLLIYAPLETYFGYDFRPENGGKMKNSGIELNLFFRLIDNPKFKWDIQASYSTNKNEIVEIKGDKLVTYVQGGEIVNTIGEQANSFYGYIFEGVYSTTEEAQGAGLVNNKLVNYKAGDAIFTDLSGPNGSPDGVINNFDKTIIGSSMPEHFGGFNNTVQYKNWTLNTFFQFVTGNEIFNYVRSENENMVGLENQSTKVLDRWQFEGQTTEVPRAQFDDLIGNSSFSTRWIEDGSYLRLKNISLNYTIPNEFLAFKDAQFYISASNIFTITKYLGYDPEFGHSHNHISQGIDYGQTPQPRQFILGIKLGL